MERISFAENEIATLADEARELATSILDRTSVLKEYRSRNPRLRRVLGFVLGVNDVARQRVFNSSLDPNFGLILRAKLPDDVRNYRPSIRICQSFDAKGQNLGTQILLSTSRLNDERSQPVVALNLYDMSADVIYSSLPVMLSMSFNDFMSTPQRVLFTEYVFPYLRSISNILESRGTS